MQSTLCPVAALLNVSTFLYFRSISVPLIHPRTIETCLTPYAVLKMTTMGCLTTLKIETSIKSTPAKLLQA